MESTNFWQDSMEGLNIGDNDDKDQIIIGIDFGTTYSGIAYAFSAKPDQIYTIHEWPKAHGRTFPKIPTVLKYNGNNGFQWGYKLDGSIEEKIVGIKLLLDPDQDRPLFDSAGVAVTKAELKKLKKSPAEIVTDYITAIYKHAIKVIESKMPKDYLTMLDVKFVLSVPAVWSDKAKDTTLRAAQNAGISPIELIKEPEAAALFTLNQLKFKGLREGDAITICDAGGGTVDLVSYEIAQLHPLELKELVPATGGMAGSMMINRRFEEFIRNTVGERCYLDLRETKGWRHAMRDFDENIKLSFKGQHDEDKYISFPMANIPDDANRGVKANTVTVTAGDLHAIFEPVFKEIDRLVTEQVNKVRIKRLQDSHPKGADIKAIFLVGGFGGSLFLRDSIQKSHTDIQVIQPYNTWSAIVQGAVLSKLPRTAAVISSVAERHYGVCGGEAFKRARDAGHDEHKYWDKYDETHRVDRMTWYINKGDDLERSRSIDFEFSQYLPQRPSAKQMITTKVLLMCSSDRAPDYPEKSVVTENCTLKIDLSLIPRKFFKKKTRASDGLKYQTLDYKLLVKVEGARLVFSFECAGKEYGAVIADY